MLQKLKVFFISLSFFFVYQALRLTWRVRIEFDPELASLIKNKRPVIYAFFHGDLASVVHLAGRLNSAGIVSRSRDGDLFSAIFSLFGGVPVRGSSSRGGSTALRSILRLKKQNKSFTLTVDGPKGPRHGVKPGIFELSRQTGLPIFTLSAKSSSFWVFRRAWDRAELPKPFARVVIVFRGSFGIISKTEDPRSPTLAARLQTEIFEAQRTAMSLLEK